MFIDSWVLTESFCSEALQKLSYLEVDCLVWSFGRPVLFYCSYWHMCCKSWFIMSLFVILWGWKMSQFGSLYPPKWTKCLSSATACFGEGFSGSGLQNCGTIYDLISLCMFFFWINTVNLHSVRIFVITPIIPYPISISTYNNNNFKERCFSFYLFFSSICVPKIPFLFSFVPHITIPIRVNARLQCHRPRS